MYLKVKFTYNVMIEESVIKHKYIDFMDRRSIEIFDCLSVVSSKFRPLIQISIFGVQKIVSFF